MSTENPTNPTPSSNGVKKRSRSPSDETAQSEKNPKRPNTGASTTEGDEARNLVHGGTNDNNYTAEPSETPPASGDKESSALKTVDDFALAGTGTVSSNASSPTVNQPAKASTSSSVGNRSGGSSNISDPTSPSSSMPAHPSTASAQIHMRCLIVTQDASIIIGKKGTHVNEIREKSGARVVVSESIPGNPERILNVSGPLDAVSKVWALSKSCIRISLSPFHSPRPLDSLFDG